MRKILALALLFFAVSLDAGSRPRLSVDEAFSIFHAESRREAKQAAETASDTRRGRSAAQTFERLFRSRISGKNIKKLTATDLGLIHQAAQAVVMYSLERRYAFDMLKILQELSAKGGATGEHYKATFAALVSVREFSRARALAASYPAEDFEPLPKVGNAFVRRGKPSVWTIDRNNEVRVRNIDITGRASIIAVSHPRCHFSTRAISDIASDALLAPLFRSHSVWITPQTGELSLGKIEWWNREYRDFAIAPVVRQSDWPVVDYWGTPAFFFVRDGRVVAKVVGWPKEGRRDELVAAAQKAGLLRDAASQRSPREK